MEVAGIKPLDAEAQAVHGPDLGSPVPIQLLLKDRILTSLVGRLLLVLSGADQERGTWLQVRLVVGRLLLTRGGGWGGEDGGGLPTGPGRLSDPAARQSSVVAQGSPSKLPTMRRPANPRFFLKSRGIVAHPRPPRSEHRA